MVTEESEAATAVAGDDADCAESPVFAPTHAIEKKTAAYVPRPQFEIK